MHQVNSINWKAVVIGSILIVLGGALGSLVLFPYSWLVSSVVGIIGLFVGMKIQRTPLVKTFSRTISGGANITLQSQAEGKVIKAVEKKDT